MMVHLPRNVKKKDPDSLTGQKNQMLNLNLKSWCWSFFYVASHKWTRAGGGTNLQIPVNDPVNVAVMDTLQDLLYAVAVCKRKVWGRGQGRREWREKDKTGLINCERQERESVQTFS